jgi:hypothetical protein
MRVFGRPGTRLTAGKENGREYLAVRWRWAPWTDIGLRRC